MLATIYIFSCGTASSIFQFLQPCPLHSVINGGFTHQMDYQIWIVDFTLYLWAVWRWLMNATLHSTPPQSSCMCISDRSTSPILQAFCGKNALSSTLCYRLKHAHNYGLLSHGTYIWHLATIESYLSYLIAKTWV